MQSMEEGTTQPHTVEMQSKWQYWLEFHFIVTIHHIIRQSDIQMNNMPYAPCKYFLIINWLEFLKEK